MSEWCVVCCWDSVVFYILVSGGDILKRNVEFFGDTHSSPVTNKVTHRPTKVGKHSVWEGVRGRVCVGVEGRVGRRCVCMGEYEGYVCGSVVCGNVVYVGVRGGCVNGEGIGIENMFHY